MLMCLVLPPSTASLVHSAGVWAPCPVSRGDTAWGWQLEEDKRLPRSTGEEPGALIGGAVDRKPLVSA